MGADWISKSASDTGVTGEGTDGDMTSKSALGAGEGTGEDGMSKSASDAGAVSSSRYQKAASDNGAKGDTVGGERSSSASYCTVAGVYVGGEGST